jgi:acetyl-CoA carboxylase carboxyltransferase component
MVNAGVIPVVPKFTVIVGNSYVVHGNYAMCGKAYDPRLIFAWPSAELAVMGGNTSRQSISNKSGRLPIKKSAEADEAKGSCSFIRSKPVMTNRFHLIMLPLAFGLDATSILL